MENENDLENIPDDMQVLSLEQIVPQTLNKAESITKYSDSYLEVISNYLLAKAELSDENSFNELNNRTKNTLNLIAKALIKEAKFQEGVLKQQVISIEEKLEETMLLMKILLEETNSENSQINFLEEIQSSFTKNIALLEKEIDRVIITLEEEVDKMYETAKKETGIDF